MMMFTPNALSEMEPVQRLTMIYGGLNEADRRTLLAFAEFLNAGWRPAAGAPVWVTPAPGGAVGRSPDGTERRRPTPLPRPEQETVIAAIRRLTLTYPMLDRAPMLHETAALMSAHVLHGRPAAAVIDDLEGVFLRHYQEVCAHRAGPADPPHADA